MITRKEIISDLLACRQALSKVNVPWEITDGLVLGYARYGDIMSWDTDIDTGIFVELTDEKWEVLHQALAENGFNLPAKRTDCMYSKRRTEFCIGIFHKNGDYYEQFPETTPGIKFVEKAAWHDQSQIINFLDDKFPMPNNIQDYLNCRYEEDWATNIIKDPEAFFCYKRGSRKQSDWLKSRSGKHGHLWPKILNAEDSMKGW